MTDFTKDSLFGGRLHVRQPRSGYRFSMDAVALAGLADMAAGDRVLDLGTGCGIIPLMLAFRYPGITVYGVEIQKNQADLAAENVADNRLENRVTILHQDIKTLTPSQTFGAVDMVVCNPPHIEKSRGRINPNNQAAISRHEIKITLKELIRVSEQMLAPMGKLLIIFPCQRLADLMEQMRICAIEPKEMHIIYTKADAIAKRVLLKGVKGGGTGLKINPPFIIHNADGTYTAAAQQIFGH